MMQVCQTLEDLFREEFDELFFESILVGCPIYCGDRSSRNVLQETDLLSAGRLRPVSSSSH